MYSHHKPRELLQPSPGSSHHFLRSFGIALVARPRFVIGILAVTLLTVAGCGKSGPQRLPVFPVEGQILVNNKPLANVQVYLHPKSADTKAQPAQARTDQEGKFKVTTYELGDGAAPGEYSITVEYIPTIKTPDGYDHGPNELPAKLASKQTTDWTIQVAEQPTVLPVKKNIPLNVSLTLSVYIEGLLSLSHSF